METTYNDESKVAILSGGQTLHAVHRSNQCLGEACPIHNPSDHGLRAFDLHYNAMAGSFFRDVDGHMEVDPDDYVLNTAGQVIVLNMISCNHCGDLVASTHRHDFRQCSCGMVAADGGSAYLRRLGSAEDYTELSVIVYKK